MSEDIVRGGEIVARLKDAGIPLAGAFWRHNSESGSWRLVLASSDIKDGPTKLGSRASRAVPPSDFLDLEFVAPEDSLFTALNKASGAVQTLGRRIRNTLIDGRYIDDAFVYSL